MKQNNKRYIFSLLTIFVFFITCDNKKLITEPGEEPNDTETIISVSGKVSPYPGTSINTVGLFHYHWEESIQEDNTIPFTITTVTDSEWVLEIPDITKNSKFDSISPTGYSSGDPIYKFLIFGWTDNDEDGRFDPKSGEVASLSHIGSDTFNIANLYYTDRDSSLLINNWWGGSDTLKNNNYNWLVKDVSTSSQISQWTYRNDNYNVLSNLAERGGYYNNTDGYTVWLSTSDISCSNPSVPRPKMNIRYPELTTRTYFNNEILINMFSSNSNSDSNAGFAGLTHVDTVMEKRIKGWVVLERIGGFNEDDTSRVYGTFDVPYCP